MDSAIVPKSLKTVKIDGRSPGEKVTAPLMTAMAPPMTIRRRLILSFLTILSLFG